MEHDLDDGRQDFLLTIGPGGPAMHRFVQEELQATLDVEHVERFGQARFFFSASIHPIERFFRLRSPEKLYAVVLRQNALELPPWPDEREAAEEQLARQVASRGAWTDALRAWQRFGREGVQSFRVTAKRAGKLAAHLSSNGIAEFVGEALAEAMGWTVDLHDYDLEVMIHLNDEHLIACLPLLERSCQQAQLPFPGLSQPVAWAMARTVEPSPGDLVLDPMCGSGILLLEAAQCWPGAFYLGLDDDPKQLERSRKNSAVLEAAPCASLSFGRSDARRLPLKSSSVDAVLCDLPFGKQYGSEEDNLALYPAVLAEFWRVLRLGTGRAALLTNQANSKTLIQAMAGRWHVECQRKVLLGNMEALLFLATPVETDGASSGYPAKHAKQGCRLPWEDATGRRQWSAMKATLRPPLRLVTGGKKCRRGLPRRRATAAVAPPPRPGLSGRHPTGPAASSGVPRDTPPVAG
ncbi:unnamed protein product [Durusdinium trenchii]|uniref:THUMP domain-containing protein n=2 Tax=Durusdinium trenchii TaxID=1381693 RepID=A0ABP0I8J4_9DINO